MTSTPCRPPWMGRAASASSILTVRKMVKKTAQQSRHRGRELGTRLNIPALVRTEVTDTVGSRGTFADYYVPALLHMDSKFGTLWSQQLALTGSVRSISRDIGLRLLHRVWELCQHTRGHEQLWQPVGAHRHHGPRVLGTVPWEKFAKDPGNALKEETVTATAVITRDSTPGAPHGVRFHSVGSGFMLVGDIRGCVAVAIKNQDNRKGDSGLRSPRGCANELGSIFNLWRKWTQPLRSLPWMRQLTYQVLHSPSAC